MDGYVRIVGTGSDSERMPLGGGDGWNVQQKPLASFIPHRRLVKLDLECIIWMANDLRDLGSSARVDFPVDAFAKVETATPELPTPAFVTDAVIPEWAPRKWRIRMCSITDEASSSMRIESKQEDYEEVMSVPESLIRLLPYLYVCSGEH